MFESLNWTVLSANPCIDRNLYLGTELTCGTLNRVNYTVASYAGKGLNVATVAARLGQKVDYLTFSDGMSGYAQEAASREGFYAYEAMFKCGIRTNTKIIEPNGRGTECNEKGGPISEQEFDGLKSLLLNHIGDIVVLSGSLPKGAPIWAYREMIREVRAVHSDSRIALDADGDFLKYGCEAGPDWIKPNRKELSGLCGYTEAELQDFEKLKEACTRVFQTYGCDILCTLDNSGAVYAGKEGFFRVPAADVPPRGFSGAGDTFLGAFISAKEAGGLPVDQALAFASRAAGAKVALEGTALPYPNDIEAVASLTATVW